jgi:ribosomal protein L22
MSYTFTPKERHAKARTIMYASSKHAQIICRLISKKKLTTVKRLLEQVLTRDRDIDHKYYSKAVEGILNLLKSCEKNAEALGLDMGKLFVYAASSNGGNLRRGRRRSDFGHRMKVTNLSIILVEKGKEAKKAEKKPAKKEKKKAE